MTDTASTDPEALIAHHALEYPGGYTRSLGPVVGRYLTGLRDGRIEGVRLADGRVAVPPPEADPATGDTPTEWVTVGPAGRVLAWTWVDDPKAGKHHLGRPFAFALVRPDGADTPMLHVVDAAGPDDLAVGLRVAPRWAASRTGHVTDLEAWVPLADGEEPAAAPANEATTSEDDADGADGGPVTAMVAPIRLDFEINAGVAPSKFLRGLARGKIIGQRSRTSDEVYLPPRGSDPKTGEATEIEVEVSDVGTITTYCVVNVPGLSENAPEIPYVSAQILLDGAHTPVFGLIRGIEWDQVRMGMRVRAIWADELAADQRSIKWYEPTGEDDADYETYRDYL